MAIFMSEDNNNYDNLLVEAVNPEEENVDTDTAHINYLKSLQNILRYSIKPGEGDSIEYIIPIVKKTVKQEDALIRQILYTGFSAYSKDPINLGIMAPTSEGKTHAAIETLQYFPKEDVWKIGSMSPKVIIRLNGILVDENNAPVEERIKELKRLIKKEEDEEIKESLSDELTQITSEAKILIDLTNKIFLFLEPPHPETWDILKPILSHDLYEIEHPYVFNVEGHGFKVKKIVTRGWPACVFCSAKHESNWPTWPEIQSRFLITSPNMIKQKYEESNLLIAQRKGLPKSIQQQIIISDKDKEIAQTGILHIKEKIKNNAILLSSSSTLEQCNYESVSVWIPYTEILASALPSDKGTDVRVAKRIFSFLELLALIKSESRFKLLYGPELLIVASIEDLAEVLYLTQDLNGIPPYKMQFFENVFIPLFNSKDTANEKEGEKEEIIAVTSKELSEYYKLKEGKTMTESNIRKTYLAEFLQNGLVDETNSTIDGRYKIYYPLVELPSEEKIEGKYKNYMNSSHSHNLFQYCKIRPSKNYINVEKKWLKSAILTLMRYGNSINTFQFAIFDYESNEKICICQFEKKYEESKYGPLILLFSDDKYCNSYNKIFGDIKYIGDFSVKDDKKLEESMQFLQYSYLGIKEVEKVPPNNLTKTLTITDTNSSTYLLSKNNDSPIEKFFDSDFGQQEEHTFEDSICRPLIGQHNHKPFFYYCKEDPSVEFLYLKSIEDHIRLKDPERHKATLLEMIQREQIDKYENKNGQDITLRS
jgi:hypothetical protein